MVYTKILKNMKNFRGETEGEFFSWVLRIGYTTMIDALKKNNETDSLDDELNEP
jgi:DNA-directed RNA polymerase specialized sigma24 family protein